MKHSKAVEFGELLFWAAFGLSGIFTIYAGKLSGMPAILWSVTTVFFTTVLVVDSFSTIHDPGGIRTRLATFLALMLSGFLMVLFAKGFAIYASSIALALAARRLPDITTERNSWLAVGTIEILLVVTFWWKLGWPAMLENSVAIAVYMILFVAFSMRTVRERAARDELAIANAELRASRELLAEHSRAAERLRIARDLHDTLGHNLTGLSIQLDVAARRSEGPAAEHIREAHAISRLLLSDVRDVVGELRTTGNMEFAEQIRQLTNNIDELTVHLEMPDAFGVDDDALADTLLRCVQEIITNTRRHSGAHNLWITIAATTSGLELQARDDGRGADQIKWGHGLTGMRERFAQHGGRVEVTSSSQCGFAMHAFLPQREAIT